MRFREDQFLRLYNINNGRANCFHVRVFNHGLFPYNHLNLRGEVTIVRKCFVPKDLSLFSRIGQRLPLIIIPILNRARAFKIGAFEGLVLLMYKFRVRAFPRILLGGLI